MATGFPRVFDSWLIMALFDDEPAAGIVRSLIADARASHTEMWITTVNLGEIWYSLARRHSFSEADQSIKEVHDLGFAVEDIDWDFTRRAAQFKAKYPISYADCFAAALAKQRHAELVTGDPEFRRLEKEIRIYWL